MGELKYQNLREALDDFPALHWESITDAYVLDGNAFRQWKANYVLLMQAIQDGTVKYDD